MFYLNLQFKIGIVSRTHAIAIGTQLGLRWNRTDRYFSFMDFSFTMERLFLFTVLSKCGQVYLYQGILLPIQICRYLSSVPLRTPIRKCQWWFDFSHGTVSTDNFGSSASILASSLYKNQPADRLVWMALEMDCPKRNWIQVSIVDWLGKVFLSV